jgi:hypothetical protein
VRRSSGLCHLVDSVDWCAAARYGRVRPGAQIRAPCWCDSITCYVSYVILSNPLYRELGHAYE